MEKKVILWIVIAILIIAVVFVSIKTGNTGQVVSTTQSAGQATSQVASSGMVGGC